MEFREALKRLAELRNQSTANRTEKEESPPPGNHGTTVVVNTADDAGLKRDLDEERGLRQTAENQLAEMARQMADLQQKLDESAREGSRLATIAQQLSNLEGENRRLTDDLTALQREKAQQPRAPETRRPRDTRANTAGKPRSKPVVNQPAEESVDPMVEKRERIRNCVAEALELPEDQADTISLGYIDRLVNDQLEGADPQEIKDRVGADIVAMADRVALARGCAGYDEVPETDQVSVLGIACALLIGNTSVNDPVAIEAAAKKAEQSPEEAPHD